MTATRKYDNLVFLTGSTGFLGHYILAKLLNKDSTACRVLIRGSISDATTNLASLLEPLGVNLEGHLAAGRVEIVAGQLPDQLNPNWLTDVTHIIHAAASTRFRRLGNDPYRSNVDGTQALLEAARTAKVPRFCFVSTAYAGGIRIGNVPEEILNAPAVGCNDYENSKWLAEKLVMAWNGPGRVATIVRPSILVGDRARGRATAFAGIYLLARGVELLARAVENDRETDRHAVPLGIMGKPNVRPNLIPVCWAAEKLVRTVLESRDEPGILNLVNPAPPTSAQIKDWLEEYFDLRGGEFTDRVWPWENPSRYEEGFYSAGESILDYFLRDLTFTSSLSTGEFAARPLVDKLHFMKCLKFSARVQWGRATRVAHSAASESLDPAWYFEKYLVRHIPRSAASHISGFNAIVRFIIEGSCGGEWACRYVAGRLVETGRHATSLREQFGFRVKQGTFERIIRGKAKLQDAYFSGEANIFGDVLAALKMVPLMETFLHEFPVGLI
ncbi:MAG: SDR family oxidoreductase [Planctomycetes bacterium]|nr:SDR family oxidoreductase [Planctomycetota bacterium]